MYSKYLLAVFLYNFITTATARTVAPETCISTAQCTNNAYCNPVQGRCECVDGYVSKKTANSWKCVPAAKVVGDKCEIDTQCTEKLGSHAYCDQINSKCDCKDGTNFDDKIGICIKSVPYGGYCTQSRECKITDGYASCINNTCTCNKNSYYTSDNRCVRVSKLGDSCNTDENCGNHKGGCIDGLCQCGDDKSTSRDGTRCLKAASKFGDNCIELSQCTKKLTGGECLKGKCLCPPGKHDYDTGCYQDKALGEECSDPRECYNSGYGKYDVDCLGNICTCIGGKCRHQGCAPPSCNCDTAEYHNTTDARCVIQSGYGERCNSDENCIVILGKCDKTCICFAGFVISRNKSKCLEVAEKFGDPCEEDSQCTEHLHDSVCRNGRCGCESGKHSYEDKCYKSVRLNRSCTETAECYINTRYQGVVKCYKGLCRCFGKSCTPCYERKLYRNRN